MRLAARCAGLACASAASASMILAAVLLAVLTVLPAGAATIPGPAPGPTPSGTPGGFLAQEEAQGGDCTLTVPAGPLSAKGLATPYVLDNGPNTTGCTMANSANLGAFVQATILEPGGKLFAYDPLVITAGTTPAAAPPVPDIPPGSVVTIDTGFAGNIDFLQGPGAGAFDQGLPGSPFGQVAFANGPAFFAAAHAEHVTVPALGTAADGMPCPTVRDFSLVDQDPSDNVTTLYDINGAGQTAEQGAIAGGTLIGVGSDNHLLDSYVDPALGCSPFAIPSLSSPGLSEGTQATDELLAAADQAAPVALVPVNDPMTTVGADDDIIAGDFPAAGNLSVFKTDAYRLGVGQPLLSGGATQDAAGFCKDLIAAGPRVQADAALPGEQNSLNVLGSGENLSTFMLNRYSASLSLLNCTLFTATPAPAPTRTGIPTGIPTRTPGPATTVTPAPASS
jgi:hypothetical protein